MQILTYSQESAAKWDNFLIDAPMATFLHTRRFLSYHGDRYKDCSIILEDEKRKIIGLFPAATDPSDEMRVMSHPGSTFGGLLHKGKLSGERMIEALESMRLYYATLGFESLRYKAVPHIYHQVPSADDVYALFRLSAVRYRCDLSSTIDLTNRRASSERRRRGLKKALAHGVSVREGQLYASPLWGVLEQNLQRKYDARPLHSLDEIVRLHLLFPEAIRFVVGLHESEVVAGVVLFVGPRVTHVQYVASGEVGYNLCALDAIFEHCIEKAASNRSRYFDFGTSNGDDGRYFNESLYRFKSEFGGGGVAYEGYEVGLK